MKKLYAINKRNKYGMIHNLKHFIKAVVGGFYYGGTWKA